MTGRGRGGDWRVATSSGELSCTMVLDSLIITKHSSTLILARNIVHLTLAILVLNFFFHSGYKLSPCLAAIRFYCLGIVLIQIACNILLPRKDSSNFISSNNSSKAKSSSKKYSSKVSQVFINFLLISYRVTLHFAYTGKDNFVSNNSSKTNSNLIVFKITKLAFILETHYRSIK